MFVLLIAVCMYKKKFENDNFEHMINDVNNFIDNEYTNFDI